MFTWWKMRQFERCIEKLKAGATRAQIRAVLGEPSRVMLVADADDAEHFDEIWEFEVPRRGISFSIALKNEVYSHAWNGWSLEREQIAQTKP